MSKFHLQSSQKKSTLWIGGLTALGLFIVAAVLGQYAANEETGTNLMLVVMGLTSGFLVRSSTKRGWRFAMAERSPPVPFIWNARRRIAVAWRTVAVIISGLLIISGLGEIAGGDTALALLMGFGLIVISAAGIQVGLRYGWNEAQASLLTIHPTQAMS